MRSSDWSSDVCSSNLAALRPVVEAHPPSVTPAEFAATRQSLFSFRYCNLAFAPASRQQRSLYRPAHESARDLVYARWLTLLRGKIGRASCRERVCQYV